MGGPFFRARARAPKRAAVIPTVSLPSPLRGEGLGGLGNRLVSPPQANSHIIVLHHVSLLRSPRFSANAVPPLPRPLSPTGARGDKECKTRKCRAEYKPHPSSMKNAYGCLFARLPRF